LLNATDRTIDSMINTTLIFIGGRCIEGITAAKSIRVELDYVRVCWRESEGPDEKASRYTVCLATQGLTLLDLLKRAATGSQIAAQQ
jgi:hypothetical protein